MLSVLTPAKINLFLNIRPRREDGFHELCTVMQAIQVWDRLDVQPREDDVQDVSFTSNVPDLERESGNNLVVKAYRLFWKETGLPPLGLQVHLEKEIPMQAGLGGGSSDAAAMLLMLNHLSHAGLPDEVLCRLGAHLGSDVPFFIRGGLALAGGRGELAESLPAGMVPALSILIVKPRNLHMPTAEAYQRYEQAALYESRPPDHLLMALRRGEERKRLGDAALLEPYLVNDFEKVLFMLYPQLADIAVFMRQAGLKRPLLCGSGSAMAGFASHQPEPALLRKVDAMFPREQFQVIWTRTEPGGIRQIR